MCQGEKSYWGVDSNQNYIVECVTRICYKHTKNITRHMICVPRFLFIFNIFIQLQIQKVVKELDSTSTIFYLHKVCKFHLK